MRRLTMTGLTAVILAVAATPVTDSRLPALVDGLPACVSGSPGRPPVDRIAGPGITAPATGITAPATGIAASATGIVAPATSADPDPVVGPVTRPGTGRATCRARATQVIPARGGLPVPTPGYHHLGATSTGGWSGVLGRVTVRDPEVRAGTHDFVATRFMAKRAAAGKVSWLEAGWAETGWSGEGRQRVYTFDTRRNSWTFYDQYPLRAGDQVWLYVHTETVAGAAGSDDPAAVPVWQAWLWWRGGWHLLISERLPLGSGTQVEQYVEVYVDPRRDGEFAVPRVPVDNVQVKASPSGGLRPWSQDVPTSPGHSRGRYCLQWHRAFTTWEAGDCATGTAVGDGSETTDGHGTAAEAPYRERGRNTGR